MKYLTLPIAFLLLLAAAGCKKTSATVDTSTTVEGKVLTDFANILVNPNYTDIQAKASVLNASVAAFISAPTDANLAATQLAWKNTRAAWESCEGYLFGPVEDFNYDPTMDSWPVNKVDLDALIASNNALTVDDINNLDETLKGFHAIEYLIFGVGGTQKAANVSARDKVYLSSLTQSLYATTTQLRNSWDPSQANNYTLQVVNAGNGSTKYSTRKAVFLALVGSMSDICDEVANSKMQTPFAAQDSTLDESSFSHNSVSDFRNNITGIRNAYLCQYGNGSGSGLNLLVSSKNASLDSKIQTQLNTAIASFATITVSYEQAIYTQKSQVKAVQAAINTLKETLDTDLTAFVQANVKD